MASRSLADLCPTMRAYAGEWLERCAADVWLKANGITVLITCTHRSNEEQAKLYAQGRTAPGRIVTKAKPGQSKHNVMLNGKPAAEAFDFVPLRYGKAIWGTNGNGIDNDPDDDQKDDLEVWQRCGAIAEGLGLNWFGRPDASFREMPHVQLELP